MRRPKEETHKQHESAPRQAESAHRQLGQTVGGAGGRARLHDGPKGELGGRGKARQGACREGGRRGLKHFMAWPCTTCQAGPCCTAG